jgi:hypothetical protein
MFNENNILYWWFTSTEKNGSMYDNIVIVYKGSNVIKLIPFKRCKGVFYKDATNDYVENYSQNVDFIKLFSKLNKQAKKQFINKAYGIRQ